MIPEILTASGALFNFLTPHKSVIRAEDIGHALSHICRYTGHSKIFFSVAQHSVHVSRLVPEEYAFAGLMHDAAEAYIGDVASPLKHLLPDYRAIEARVEAAIFSRFGLPPVMPPCVKEADLAALAAEKRDLLPESANWQILEGVCVPEETIQPLCSERACDLFMDRFYTLVHQRNSGDRRVRL